MRRYSAYGQRGGSRRKKRPGYWECAVVPFVVTFIGMRNKELTFYGITTMDEANRYLSEVYRSAFNAEFMKPAAEESTAFVPWHGTDLDEILCEQYERSVSSDNCIRFEGMTLQIPANRYRCTM